MFGSENASRERGNYSHLQQSSRGKLNIEDHPDGVRDPLSLALGPEAEVVVVSACANSG